MRQVARLFGEHIPYRWLCSRVCNDKQAVKGKLTKSRDQVLFRSFLSPRLISPRLRLVVRPRFFGGFAVSSFAVLCFGGVERCRSSTASSGRAVSLSVNSLTSFLPIGDNPISGQFHPTNEHFCTIGKVADAWITLEPVLPEIKSEHSTGVIRRELVSVECAQRPEQPAAAAHPCSEINVSAHCCNSAYKKGAHGAGAARRRRRHINQPFRMAILPWRVGRSWPVANAHRAKPRFEYLAVGAIAIADDVPRPR